jgi:hypothetical protein
MRRILLIALLGATLVAIPASTALAKAKPLTFKTGTYTAETVPAGQSFKITLKHTKCAGKLQFCVSLPPPAPFDECTTPVAAGGPFGALATPAALSASGKLTAHQAVMDEGPISTTGQMTFAIAFTKKGTATGSLEVSLSLTAGSSVLPCSNKTPFKAKLG